jgi:spermidine/putrescine-binding protein
MSHKTTRDQLFADFMSGRKDRRSFIRDAITLGASVTALGAFLEACGGGPEPAAAPPPTDAPPAPAPDPDDLGPIGTELNIYNWSDYIAEDTVALFEKETGIKVRYDTYESNEEMMAKLQVGAGGYDMVVPTGYIVTVLGAQGLLAPLKKKYLTNWGNVAPLFLDPAFDPGNEYAVPWQWGTTGIAYRSDKVNPPPDSWGIFLDPKWRRRMTQMDDVRDVIGSWLRYRGHSLNATDPALLDAAKADAIASKALLKAYLSAPVKGQLVAGDVLVAQLWNGDTAQAAVEEPSIKYVVPKEGGSIWTDSLVIPKTAPNKRAAHEFMNFILRPDIAAGISNFTGYGTPNAAAMDKLESPVPYPDEEERKRLEYQKDLGAATDAWDQLWTEIKSA